MCGWTLLDTSKALETEEKPSIRTQLSPVCISTAYEGWLETFTPEFEQYRLFYIKHTEFERDVCTVVYR